MKVARSSCMWATGVAKPLRKVMCKENHRSSSFWVVGGDSVYCWSLHRINYYKFAMFRWWNPPYVAVLSVQKSLVARCSLQSHQTTVFPHIYLFAAEGIGLSQFVVSRKLNHSMMSVDEKWGSNEYLPSVSDHVEQNAMSLWINYVNVFDLVRTLSHRSLSFWEIDLPNIMNFWREAKHRIVQSGLCPAMVFKVWRVGSLVS